MGYLFDDWQPETRFLFDMHPEMLHGRIKTLMDTDYVIVVNQTVSDTAHGVRYEPDGDPIKVICSVEGRQNQAGMFANSGQEDVPQDQGGLTEITPIQIIAREWPGDIHSQVWYDGDMYDTIGSPVERKHGTDRSRHWEIRAEIRRRDVPEPTVPEGSRTWGM